jgi:2-iminoacetate synthase
MLTIINENKIFSALSKGKNEDKVRICEILAKALELKGLNLEEATYLINIKNPELIHELFVAASKVKEDIYGKRIVIFAPLYISNVCKNECLYCAFRHSNKELKRTILEQQKIASEIEHLINQGHKRILLEAGEAYPNDNIDYVIESIATIYGVKNKHGEIRRVNVNVAPLTIPEFKRLKEAKIGTYQLFQETYHCETYNKVHTAGNKADYNFRITAFDRALTAGIHDIGLGALFGLYDWRFEVLALLEHANYLQNNFGVGPHTISVPRLKPAFGSEIASHPFAPVDDNDFCKIVAILRLAVPYTGIIMSTRESAQIREQTLALGVSQVSAGSRTTPGAYTDNKLNDEGQFSIGDHRTLDEVVRDLAEHGYMPSFCTACYRVGRTGEKFMGLAKRGDIKDVCTPNAIASFAEYLTNYASPATKTAGNKLIGKEINSMANKDKQLTSKLLEKVSSGEEDVFV